MEETKEEDMELFNKLKRRYETVMKESKIALNKMEKLSIQIKTAIESHSQERYKLIARFAALREEKLKFKNVHFCPVCAEPLTPLNKLIGPSYSYGREYLCPKCNTRFKVTIRKEEEV